MLTTALAALGAGLLIVPRLPRLRSRYDQAALCPITGKPALHPGDERVKVRLGAWAFDGAGSGATLLPWSRPRVPTPFSRLDIPPEEQNSAHQFGYRLAGYHQLDERSRLGGLLYRIGVQVRPLALCLPRSKHTPWDDAWFDEVRPSQWTALESWQPRRPTLIVLTGLASAQAARMETQLRNTSRRSEYPIRLLVVAPHP